MLLACLVQNNDYCNWSCGYSGRMPLQLHVSHVSLHYLQYSSVTVTIILSHSFIVSTPLSYNPTPPIVLQ